MTSISTAPKFSSTCDFGNHTNQYLTETVRILQQIDAPAVDRMVDLLVQCKQAGGRIFFLGVGGGAAHASHAVNDFRKIAGFEAYAPSDNVAELTARINDEGWEGAYAAWLEGSRLGKQDVVFVFSVGGGDEERRVSLNLVRALDYARAVGARIAGVVGRDGGHTARVADACAVVPVVNPAHITPHTESLQAVVWHLLVSHPRLQVRATKWESGR